MTTTSQSKLYLYTALLLLVLCLIYSGFKRFNRPEPIKVGVLLSLSGTMADSERLLLNAISLAMQELNQQGGLLGRPLELVPVDGRSDPQVFAAEAERLVRDPQISVLMGCWTSACRKAVKPIIERYNHLLFYPVQYEGIERSDNIVYLGAAPNQQIMPGINWALDNLGERLYLLGSDYVFPRMANLIISDLAVQRGAKVLRQQYLPLGSQHFEAVVDDIAKIRPQVIINTLNGDSNRGFFHALVQANLTDIPVMSFSVTENEMLSMDGSKLPQHYAVWSYFQSLDNQKNRQWITRYQQQFGRSSVLTSPMLQSYSGIYLWAQAVREAGSVLPDRVRRRMARQSINSPAGIMVVDASNFHVWQAARIGLVQPNGQFRVVWQSERALAPEPFPSYRSRRAWQQMLNLAVEQSP